MKLTILGPQGSGKSTQAKLLSEKFDIPVIDMGGLIRKVCEIQNDYTKEACELMKKGELVPHGFASSLLRTELGRVIYRKGFILDGYPRKYEDLLLYEPNPDKVLYIEIPDEIAIQRLQKRGRMDDTKVGIEKRLAWYHEKTSKVLEYYRQKKKLYKIDGDASPDEVFKRILQVV